MMLYRRANLLAVILILGSSCLVAMADDERGLLIQLRPTTLPATQTVARPATQPASPSQLQVWFDDLAASDAVVRERAYSELLGLARQDLPALREVVERSRPVAPSQAAALRDVVTHVYLSGEPYRAEKSGFLGVMQSAELYSVEVPGEDLIGADAGNAREQIGPRTGVPIAVRLPGFCAFRALREGDVVLGIVEPLRRPMSDWNEFTLAVMSFPAGQTVTFELLRGGRLIRVPIRLDARPADARPREPRWVDQVIPERAARAEAYWAQQFQPLVEDRVSSAAQ